MKTNHQEREGTRFIDPTLLRAATKIYTKYCSLHSQKTDKPHGVAIDCDSLRGHLIFYGKPILLPGECFIHLRHLESQIS